LPNEIISVLIPTYNAEKEIKELLTQLNTQELDKGQELEIIVVDSSSTDSTIKIITENFPNVKYRIIENKRFDHGGTRNYLASMSAGHYLLFMTQDAIPCNQSLIKNLLKPFHTFNNIAISYARQVPKKDANPLEVFARSFNYPEESALKSKESLPSLGIKTFFNSNVCSMYKRDLFENFNGFPEEIILNEDMILSSKLILNGYLVSYTSEAKVYHSHNYKLKNQFKRYFDIGMAFENTSYLLSYASNEKEGIRMVITQMKYLFNKKEIYYIPLMILEAGVKYLGYKLGLRHKLFPNKIKKRLSAYMK
jgi:rhamnosyltransferase